jgi:hypothetical protein
MAFTLAGGMAYWDRAGKVPASAGLQLAWRDVAETEVANLTGDQIQAIAPLAVASVQIQALTRDARGFHATLAGEPGHRYLIEASEDLVNWVPLSEVQADAQGRFELHDPAAAGHRARFYRIIGD